MRDINIKVHNKYKTIHNMQWLLPFFVMLMVKQIFCFLSSCQGSIFPSKHYCLSCVNMLGLFITTTSWSFVSIYIKFWKLFDFWWWPFFCVSPCSICTLVTCNCFLTFSVCLCTYQQWNFPAFFYHFQVFAIVKICFTIKLCLTRKMAFNIESLTSL